MECILGCSNYCQETWKKKRKTRISLQIDTKNSKKDKSNRKYNTYHGPLSQEWYVMLAPVMNNLLLGFAQPLSRLCQVETQHPWLKITQQKIKGSSQWNP